MSARTTNGNNNNNDTKKWSLWQVRELSGRVDMCTIFFINIAWKQQLEDGTSNTTSIYYILPYMRVHYTHKKCVRARNKFSLVYFARSTSKEKMHNKTYFMKWNVIAYQIYVNEWKHGIQWVCVCVLKSISRRPSFCPHKNSFSFLLFKRQNKKALYHVCS